MTTPHPNSLLLQLRARECVRLWSHGGAASHSALPLSRSAPHRITDELDAASICAQALRSKSSSTLPQHILLGHTGCVNAVAVSDGATSHGRWIASAGDDERVLLWDAYLPVLEVHANSGHTVRFIQSGRSGAHHERQSLDADLLAAPPAPRSAATYAGSIHRGFARAFGGHSANIFGLQFTPDSRRIVSCGLDAGILMFDIETGGASENGGALRAPIRSFTGHESSVHRTSFIKDSNEVFLSASNDHTCRLFDARASGSRAQLVGGLGYSLNSVHCSPTDEHAFVTAGKALCLHDLRQMHASKPTAPPPTTRSAMGRAQQLARTAMALRRGQMPPDEDEDAAEEGAGAGAADAGSDDDESEFNALLRIMLSGRSSARATPIAVMQSFDLTTLTPPAAPVVSTRTAAAARGSARGRGAGRGARGRGASSRSRGRGRGSAAASGAGDASSPSAAVPAAPSSGRARGRGRSGRGRGARAAATAASTQDAPADDDEMPESDRRAAEAADTAAAAPRRSSRNRPAVEVEDAEDDDEAEAPSSFPTPNERRRERLAQLTPPREASSCEYSSDGRFVLASMMKANPLLFDVTRPTPVLSMQSRGAFSGYSHTCTLKSAVFAGPDDRFVIAGSDNFGIFAWDRTLQREDILGVTDGAAASSSSAATSSSSSVAAAASSSSTTFLNACKILRGHRSIPNNQRFHPQLMQILSCGVEKVVRVFNCNRVPADLHQREREADEPAGTERVAGDVLPAAEAQRLLRLEHIPTQATDALAGAAASSASAHKRAASDKLAKCEEKKARSQRESSSAMVDEGEQERKSSSSAAAASSSSSSAAAPVTAAAASSSAASSPSSDPLYRMVKTYSTVRDPYTRLQCAYLLSGGAAAFGAAASMFADAEDEVAAVRGDEADPRSNDSMAEDRACLAQFDFYVSRSVAGEPSDGSESEDDIGIEAVSSEDDDAEGEGGETETHHTFLDLNSDEERRMREALNMSGDEDEEDEEEEA